MRKKATTITTPATLVNLLSRFTHIQEIRIECFFPADASTAAIFTQWAAL